MPSLRKTLHFLGSTAAIIVGVGLLGYGMSTSWVVSSLHCEIQDTELNGKATVTLGLFSLSVSRTMCPSFSTDNDYTAFTKLKDVGGAPFILHILVIFLLVISLVTAAGSILISLYNSISNPYQTHFGPLGLYTCSGSSAVFSFLALILFVANVFATNLSQDIVLQETSVILRDLKDSMQGGFFLLIPFIAMNLLAIVVVFVYQHAAYTHQKEQQKPTEDAPKEIMMY